VGSFKGRLEPVPHGGLFVVVPADVASKARITHGARVRGTVNGVAYRSALMKYSGVFHLGIHKQVARAAGLGEGARVAVTVEADRQPLPTDILPDDLASALSADGPASSAWQSLSPAVRRGYVKGVLDAKKSTTRARRVGKIVDLLHDGVPPRRTWVPDAAKKAAAGRSDSVRGRGR
jgi:hypothetical protein